MQENNLLNGKEFLSKLCSAAGPTIVFGGSTTEDFAAWRADAVKKLEDHLHLDAFEYCDIAPEKLKEEHLTTSNGIEYIRQLWNITTMPSLKMPLYVLKPQSGNNKAGLVLHCHGSDGKNGIVGIINDDLMPNYAKLKFTYALELLEKGYTVICPDLLGSGARKPVSSDKIKASDCTVINNTLMVLGLNLQGMIVYELKRAVDFIFTLGVDASDLICVGFSGGALSAAWLAAIDERIKRTYISGYFHSFKATLLQSNYCGCNFIPDMWKTIDMDALLMLAAPRTFYVEIGEEDKLNGTNGLELSKRMAENVKDVYTGIFNSDNFKFKVCEGAHRWNGAFMDEI